MEGSKIGLTFECASGRATFQDFRKINYESETTRFSRFPEFRFFPFFDLSTNTFKDSQKVYNLATSLRYLELLLEAISLSILRLGCLYSKSSLKNESPATVARQIHLKADLHLYEVQKLDPCNSRVLA